jgi:hypothetical protein
MQQLIRRLRMPAVLCCLSIPLAALIVHPYLEMGINDDWSYTRTAQVLAQTGHIVYNGWATAMVGWQLLPAVLFIKLFGFSFTAVRLSILPIAMLATFLMQRALVRAGLNEWNASIATLTMVLSPLFLPLSLSYMTDVPGFFTLVLCFYACLRALQTESDLAAIGWVCLASVSGAVGGTARQIAWLGLLVMVPSALWLLRRRARILLAGVPVYLAGGAFIFMEMRWFGRQPYNVPEPIVSGRFDLARVAMTVGHLRFAAMELPLFLLPVLLAFVPAIWRNGRVVAVAFTAGLLALLIDPAYLYLFAHRRGFLFLILEPYLINCFSVNGIMDVAGLAGARPSILHIPVRVVLTVVTFVCADAFLLACVAGWRPLGARATIAEDNGSGGVLHSQVSEARSFDGLRTGSRAPRPSWYELRVLLLPFCLAYIVLLLPRASVVDGVYDRYLLILIMMALLTICRLYQERVRARLPLLSVAMLGVMAWFSVALDHDFFALGRARLAAVGELRSAGVPATDMDAGLEYNFWTQAEKTGSVNDFRIVNPPGFVYRPTPVYAREDHCHPARPDELPDITAYYALSFEPDVCGGPAGFAPVFYRTWLGPHPTAIYVVKYLR